MDEPEPSDEQSAGISTPMLIVVGVIIGLVVAFGVGPISDALSDDDSVEVTTTPPPTVDASIPADDNADAVDLVVAYGRSRTDTHALTGQVLRPGQQPVPVRRAILDDRAIDETGDTAAVTEAGETRQCELIEGQWLCAPPLPAITADIDVQGFATLLLAEQPTYTVFAVSSEPPDSLSSIASLGSVMCWSMVSDGRVDRARFGAETTMCFHDELGALIGQVTETSGGEDLFIADEIRGDVDIADVEPSR